MVILNHLAFYFTFLFQTAFHKKIQLFLSIFEILMKKVPIVDQSTLRDAINKIRKFGAMNKQYYGLA
jgi:hypothetical protein